MIPHLWRDILAKMPDGSAITGGALRDDHLGLQAKDLDILIPSHINIFDAAGLIIDTHPTVEREIDADYISSVQVLDVLELSGVGVLPVNIIQMADAVSAASRSRANDFGICQIWLEKDGQIRETEHFLHDVQHKSFTLRYSDSQRQFDHSMTRYERLAGEKFAGWKLVIPPQFNKFRDLEEIAS